MGVGSDIRPASGSRQGQQATTGDAAVEGTPLGAMRFRLDPASAGARWTMNPDGVRGRALWMDAGARACYPLVTDTELRFGARVMLLPHDWRDGGGAVRATISATGTDGSQTVLWTGVLRASDRGRPRGHQVRCAVPATATALSLGLEAEGPARASNVMRAVWLEPMLAADRPGLSAAAPGSPERASAPSAPAEPGPAPLISVLTPVHNPPRHMLEEAIASVQKQTYPHWELCLVDDGSSDPEIIAALNHHAAADPRIHLARHDTAGGISAATNHALTLATGDYIALLDHDDTLTPDALQHVADHITADPTLDMLYSDEDILGESGRQIWVHIKPAWSPDTLRTNGYTCHLGVYRRSLVEAIGGFRTEFNGSQDVDMILRLTERTDRVANIPRVLYHWRAHASSTAGGDAKPYAYVAARNAIAAHLDRVGVDAEVGYGPPGLYRVAHRVDRGLGIDLALALDSLDGLAAAAQSWRQQPHPSWELTIAAPTRLHAAITDILATAGITADRVTLLADEHQDPTSALAHAADAGHSEHLLLMQSPAVGLTHDWLTRLIGYSHQPGIAAAGPIVLAPDGRIQQAGIAMPTGHPLHLLHGTRSSMDLFFGYGTSVYNVLAVSGILATPRATFQKQSGLDPDQHEFALIDYCLRATQDHDRVVIVPDTRLRTTGPDPTTNDLPALRRLHHTWAARHRSDPYYNPSYRTDRGDFEVVSG